MLKLTLLVFFYALKIVHRSFQTLRISLIYYNDSFSLYFLLIYRCRAPIASLDCMEEFSGTGGHLDFGINAFFAYSFLALVQIKTNKKKILSIGLLRINTH